MSDFSEYSEDNISDEMSQIHAEYDMKQERQIWLLNKANEFYADFNSVDISTSINSVQYLIDEGEISIEVAVETLDNMISLFVDVEEYEKCDVCNKIKKGIENATI